MYFYKRLLGVKRNVPNYLIRLETGASSMSTRVLKQALLFWIKLRETPPERYTRACFDALVHPQYQDIKFNWALQLRNTLNKLGYGFLFETEDTDQIKNCLYEILIRHIDIQRQDDISSVNNSKVFNYYKHLIREDIGPSNYLFMNLPFSKLTLLAQCRLNNGDFYFEKNKHYLVSDTICTICNYREEETLEHFITKCNLYRGSRLHWISATFGEDLPRNWVHWLSFESTEHCYGMYKYLCESLRLRKLVLDE